MSNNQPEQRELVCRHCGRPLHTFEQGINPRRIDGEIVFTDTFIQVDCRHEDCPLYCVTLGIDQYFTIDLTPYLTKAGR